MEQRASNTPQKKRSVLYGMDCAEHLLQIIERVYGGCNQRWPEIRLGQIRLVR